MIGCQQDEITSTRVPKDVEPTVKGITSIPPVPSDGMGLHGPQGKNPDLTWKRPESWTEEPPSQMRVGSFKAQAANGQIVDISIVPLSGEAGGLLANVNRWRGQISLPSLSESDLPSQLVTIRPGGREMTYVQFSNQGRRIAAAILERKGRTWFFKMSGEDQAVRSQEETFQNFLSDLKFADE